MKIVLFLLLFLIIPFQAQTNWNTKKFNVKSFEIKKDKYGIYNYKKGNLLVNSRDDGEYYFEEVREQNKLNFIRIYAYDRKGNLLGESYKFKNLNIDKALEYNNEGVIVKEIDFSRPNFTFSIYQLIEKVKNEFNIDLNNSVDWKIDMLIDNPKKIYEWLVVGHILNKEQQLRHLKTLRFDGATGKFMSMEDGYYGFNAIE